jgi:hypothetical protein
VALIRPLLSQACGKPVSWWIEAGCIRTAAKREDKISLAPSRHGYAPSPLGKPRGQLLYGEQGHVGRHGASAMAAASSAPGFRRRRFSARGQTLIVDCTSTT